MTPEEIEKHLSDQRWRLNNLYTIVDKDGVKRIFEFNWHQEQLYSNMWFSNIILKARQLGISTFVSLLFLDLTLFKPNVAAGIIAHTREDAEHMFKRIKFAYDQLPDAIKQNRTASVNSARELVFNNNSSLRVGTSMRGSTLQYLHISEFGKICSHFPDKAREIVTGSLNTLGNRQYVFIESTAEGKEGYFYDLCKQAEAHQVAGKKLTPLDYRFHFFPWFNCPDYSLNEKITIPKEIEEYFTKLSQLGIKLPVAKRAWYYKKLLTQKDDMKREYPSCIAAGTPILSYNGIYPIEDVIVDGINVFNKVYMGEKKIYEVKTSLGYRVKSTLDHLFLSNGIYKELNSLKIGDSLHLEAGGFPLENYIFYYQVNLMVKGTVEITEDFGRFIGYFMGDGSYFKGQVSVCCDSQDEDVIDDVRFLLDKFIGIPGVRKVGSKKGGTELRVSRKELSPFFLSLGIVRQNGSFGFKRRIHVPDFIKKSPRDVVKNFLMALFEADGFAARDGNGVKIHSKYQEFLMDVQLLLLQFGITSKLSAHDKKCKSTGGFYVGYELVLRRYESLMFRQNIGMVSKRKNARLEFNSQLPHYNALKMSLTDCISSIAETGISDVYDLTTVSSKFSAGGIVVHNCPDEAFESSIDGSFYAKWIRDARFEGRIGNVPWDRESRVCVAFDPGYLDSCAVVFFQCIGQEIHVIDYYENSGEGLAHYMGIIKKKPYVYDRYFGPHDIESHQFSTGLSTRDVAGSLGVSLITLPTLKMRLEDGIEAVRSLFPRIWIDEKNCSRLIKCIENYRKEFDVTYQIYKSRPIHDQYSHGADAFRYACIAIKTCVDSAKSGISDDEADRMYNRYNPLFK